MHESRQGPEGSRPKRVFLGIGMGRRVADRRGAPARSPASLTGTKSVIQPKITYTRSLIHGGST
jgi:hypothetical protein